MPPDLTSFDGRRDELAGIEHRHGAIQLLHLVTAMAMVEWCQLLVAMIAGRMVMPVGGTR